MWTIAKVTLKEALKKKTLILIAIMTLLYLGLLGLVLYFTGQDDMYGTDADMRNTLMQVSIQIVSIVGFYFSSMLCAFMTILLSTGAVSVDLDSGVLQAILARPVSRTKWFLGKYAGHAIIIGGFATFLYASLMIACLVFGMPFMTEATLFSILGGWLLFLLEPLAILALSLWIGIRLRTVAGAILVGGAFVLSMIGSFVGQIGSLLEKPGLVATGWAAVFLFPFNALYQRMTTVFFKPTDTTALLDMMGEMTGMQIGGWIGWYALLYIGLMLAVGIRSFADRDM